MKINNFFKLIASLVISFSAGAVGSFFTAPSIQSGWYAELAKPALNPPNWIFGPVWTILYIFVGISLFLVWKNNWQVSNPIFEREKKAWNRWSERLWKGDWQKANVVLIFTVQYILNIAWSFVFFGILFPLFAFYVILALWFAILYTVVNFYRISKLSAYLLIPYILWVSFAGYLNYSIWMLN